ncbi:putative lipid II flippase FtsW [Marinospirillum insulare]|uniref:Probable peptidoglycan glycosyltransferase FtsW n=1 Tax=Marinospirillum insulare TaxID=217169 RepID=A0ABQ5ZSN8_9GAMM|nr:putative lipid II flippase FtsW [Marinospirillum insulare]GLR63145.1 putative lipid II flippase FtsW [Marinospirillum insulare]
MRIRPTQLKSYLPTFSYVKKQCRLLHQSSTHRFDGWLVFSSLALLTLGWLMVSSASVAVAEFWTGNPQHFAIRQGVFAVLGLLATFFVSQVSMTFSQQNGHRFLFLAFALLILVLLVGREVNGSTRWINFGLFNLQTSEIAKICFTIYMASYLTRQLQAVRETLSGFIRPLLLMVAYGSLLIWQPDFGSLVVVMAAVMGMVFLAGVKFRHFFLVLIAAFAALTFIAILEPYRLQRLTTFTDPWSHQFNSGYQLTQALIAFGRGHWVGLGLGNSVQKLFYLPEAHTDFIFSIIAEELGLIGGLITLGLFTLFISRIFLIARQCELLGQFFSAYLCYGLGIIFTTQILVNLGVNMGVLPTKGLTLPFISYGGSSLISSGIMLGLIFRADSERRKLAALEQEDE